MLPNPELKPVYDKVVWVYVYRDFSKSEADRAAERVSLRFGVTSWPQLFLADPHTLKIRAHTGREVPGFLRAVESTKVDATRSLDALERMREAEKRADQLERKPSVKAALRALASDDIVERFAGLRVLVAKEPKRIVADAKSLLAVPNDPFRYEVCAALKAAATPKAARALEAVVEKPENSLNPNVLRIRAVQALATCGDAASVDAVGRWAATGVYFNGLTGVAIDTLVAIRERDRKARRSVEAILKRAYPKPPEDPTDQRAMRACLGLAKRVHKARGTKEPFPKTYDEAAWRKLTGSG